MAFESNYYPQQAGQGEAVIIDPSAIQNAIERRQARRINQEMMMGRIKARQQQERDKAAKEEFYKLSNTAAGDAGFLTPYATEARERINQKYYEKLRKNEPIDENEARLDYMGEQNFRQLGKEFTQNIQKRYPELAKSQYVNPPEFERSLQAALAEDYKKYMANPGAQTTGYRPDEDRIVRQALESPLFNVYNLEKRGEDIRKGFETTERSTTPAPGRATLKTEGSGLLQQQPDRIINEVNFDLYNQGIKNPTDRAIIAHGFAQQVRNPDSFYYQEDARNQALLNNGQITPQQYEESKNALIDRFAKNEYREQLGIIPEKLGYKESEAYTAAPQGRKPKETYAGEVTISRLPAMGSKGQTVALPQATNSTPYPTKTTQLTPVPAGGGVIETNRGEVKNGAIGPESQIDTYNSKFLVVGRTTKPASFTRTFKSNGKTVTQKVNVAVGTPISSPEIPDEYRAQVFRDGNVRPEFGAMVPVYRRQYRPGGFTMLPGGEFGQAGTYLPESNMVWDGYVFKPYDMNGRSVFGQAVSNTLGRNKKGPVNLEALRQQLLKDYNVGNQLGAETPSSAEFFKPKAAATPTYKNSDF